MKNFTLLMAIGMSLGLNAQILDQDNFSSYSIGAFSSSTSYSGSGTTSTAGTYIIQTDKTPVEAGLGLDAFTIVANAFASTTNVLKIKGPQDNGGSSYIYRNTPITAWPTRTSGNNVLKMTYDIYVDDLETDTKNKFNLLMNGTLSSGGSIEWKISYAPNKVTTTIPATPFTPEMTYVNKFLTAEFVVKDASGVSISSGSTKTSLTEGAWNTLSLEFDPEFGKLAGKTVSGSSSGTFGLQYSSQANIIFNPNSIKYSVSSGVTAPAPAPQANGSSAKSVNSVTAGTQYDFHLRNINISAAAKSVLSANILPAQANANVTVYPNPTSDVLNISSKLEVLSSEIYNLGGQLVASYGAVSQLDIANLAKGNYILKINGKDKVYSQQIIKN